MVWEFRNSRSITRREEERRLLTCRVLAGVLLVTMLAGPVAQAQDTRAQSEVTLRQLEQKLVAAGTNNDWRFWDQVVAPEWTFIDHSGRTWDKPAILAMAKAVKGSIQSARLYDVQVRFFKDDVAMVTGTLTVTGSTSSKTITRVTDILVERGGKWLVVASQATLVREPR